MTSHKYIGFKDSLNEDDFGIILAGNGRVKGVWVPLSKEEETIPESVVQLCINYFGIDPNKDENLSQTLH